MARQVAMMPSNAEAVRKVQASGRVRYRGGLLRVGTGFQGYPVGIESVGAITVRSQLYELDLGEFDLAA